MATAAQALAGLTEQGAGTQLAPMQAAATQPGIWSQLMTGAENLFNDPVRMALLTGGLGLLSNQSPIQALQGAGGIYQQLLQKQADAAAAEEDAAFRDKQLGLEERRVAAGEERNEIEREKLAAQLKAAEKKVKKPTGVDKDLWKQALDTAVNEAGFDGTVSEERVRIIYNSIAPEDRQVPELFGTKQLREVVGLLSNNPDNYQDYIDLVSSQYGPAAAKRVTSVWQKMGNTVEEEGEEKEGTLGKDIVEGAAEVPAALNRVQTAPSPIAPFFNPMQALGTVQNYLQPENLYKSYPFTTLGK